MEFLLTVLGVVLVVEGMPWFLSPRRVKGVLLGFMKTPDRVLRLMGLVLMLSGLLVVYLTRRMG
jgi:hypothetical protein